MMFVEMAAATRELPEPSFAELVIFYARYMTFGTNAHARIYDIR